MRSRREIAEYLKDLRARIAYLCDEGFDGESDPYVAYLEGKEEALKWVLRLTREDIKNRDIQCPRCWSRLVLPPDGSEITEWWCVDCGHSFSTE